MFEEISAYFYKHRKIARRRPIEMFVVFIDPLIALLSVGILIYFAIQNGAPTSSLMFVFVGVVAWNFYDLTQRALTYGITFDIWSASLKHSFSAKAKIYHFILGNSLYGLLSSAIAFLVIASVGFFAFGFNIFSGGLYLINLIPIFIFAISIGLIIDSLMVSKGEKYMALIWMMAGVVMIFSGVYYPADVLPTPIKEISQLLPATHSIASMRAGFGYSTETGLAEFAIGLTLSIVYLIAGIILFKRGLKTGYENGMITNY